MEVPLGGRQEKRRSLTPIAGGGGSFVPGDEPDLVARLLAGDEVALEELVRTYGPRMFSVARGFLGDPKEAWDSVKQALLRARSAVSSYRGDVPLSTWLRRIQIETCLGRLRTEAEKRELAIEALLPIFLDDGHQASPTGPWRARPAGVRERGEALRRVKRSIRDLPPSERSILVLRDGQGLNVEDVADLLGLSVGETKSRLHRARQELLTLLDPHFSASRHRA